MRTLAIIPARGGSKRLPRKNVLDLGGKPLIAWTIEAALGCQFINKVMVTTDDEEIAEVANTFGAHVPFLRPDDLASDTTTSFDAIKHAIEFYQYELGEKYDFVVLLQPTSPLRKAQDISGAFDLLYRNRADAVVSVCEAEHSPRWMNTLPADHSMGDFMQNEFKNVRGQDLPKYYRLNGAIYICRTSRLLQEKSFMPSDNIFAYIMSKESSVDIDDSVDYKLASCLLRG